VSWIPIRRWRLHHWALASACLAAVVGLLAWRPWADSSMSASIVLDADGRGVLTQRTLRTLFRSGGSEPVTRVELDLSAWAGELARLDVSGSVSRRHAPGETGFVACSAELLTAEGARRLQFVGWQEGMEAGLHPRSIGPQACRVEAGSSFAFAMKGTLWHVFEVPEDARLRLELRPVPALSLNGPPEPYAPTAERRTVSVGSGDVRERPRPPDVFIYIIDALRADHLGCYGYERGTSPEIDGFAAEAVLYQRAYTPSTWTRPSVASILSGLYPSVHGAVHMGDQLSEWPVLLPEILREADYATYCLTANVNATDECGFDQGYAELRYVPYAPASLLNGMARHRLEARSQDQPVFMLVHTMEPHGPYVPGAEHVRVFDRGIEGAIDGSAEALNALTYVRPEWSRADIMHLMDLYDAEIYGADSGFAEFLETLKSTGRYEHAMIILVSDHGEAFGEHDTRAHGFDLNRETMGVMLIVKYPDGQHTGTKVTHPVSLMDVLPTVLGQVGQRPELAYRLPGRDLAKLMTDAGGSASPIFAEVARLDDNAVDLVGVIDEDGYKRVIDVSAPPRETAAQASLGLWDTRRDPAETSNRVDELPVRAAYGEQLIAQWLVEQSAWLDRSTAEPAPRVRVSPERERELRTLGYVDAAPRR
jgi:arylsulfatase A-like enzyme